MNFTRINKLIGTFKMDYNGDMESAPREATKE